jgi:hypothetical protein
MGFIHGDDYNKGTIGKRTRPADLMGRQSNCRPIKSEAGEAKFNASESERSLYNFKQNVRASLGPEAKD